jgi:ribose transport system permease protein
MVRDCGIVVLWLAMLVVFSVWAPGFATWTNATLILGAAAITAIFAAAVGLGVLAGVLDLSIPGAAALSGVVAGEVVSGSGPGWLALIAGLACGVAVGLVNGLAVARGLNPLVMTIGMLSVLTGLAAAIAGGTPVTGITRLAFLGTDSVGQVPAPVGVAGIVYVLGWFLLARTRAGVRLLAVGGNAEAVRRAGVSSHHYRTVAFVLSGTCAALGGIVSAASITQASATADPGVLFDALTAVALSGMPLTGGRGSLPRVLVGALISASIASVLDVRGIAPYWGTVITGVLLIGALAGERVLTAAITHRLEAPR